MTSRFKMLLYEAMHEEGTRLLEEKCDLVYAKSFEEAHLVSLVNDVDAVIIRANGAVSRAVIDAAGRLKVIGRHGVGLDGIDLAAAKERGIKVVYTPVANTESVAEHFVALALMLAKKMKQGDIAVFSKHPMSAFTRCDMTIIEGDVYFDRDLIVKEREEAAKKAAAPPRKGGVS